MIRSLVTLLLVGCASEGANSPTADAPVSNGGLPTWQLEDVNPQSARAGETYGLESFTGKVIVVTLLEGF